jgi:hypothetical protein
MELEKDYKSAKRMKIISGALAALTGGTSAASFSAGLVYKDERLITSGLVGIMVFAYNVAM